MIINLGSEEKHSWKFWTKNPRNCEMCGEEYSTNVMNERNCSKRCFEYNLLYDDVQEELLYDDLSNSLDYQIKLLEREVKRLKTSRIIRKKELNERSTKQQGEDTK